MSFSKVFKTKIIVRGYELDGYGHVNHAVYLNYCEVARWDMLVQCKLDSDYFAKNKITPVIARSEVDYKASCFLAESLIVETKLLEMRSRVAVFSQKVIKEKTGVVAAETRMTVVVVGENGRAVTYPADFIKQLED